MRTFAIICQIIIALGILNVWLFRQGRPTPFRPAGANNMADEFQRYGFPDWFRRLVGASKAILAGLLVMGIWYPIVAVGAGLAMAVLMAGAISAHVKVRDPLYRSLPALAMLSMSLFVAYANGI